MKQVNQNFFCSGNRNQKGVALITILLIVVFVSVIATIMLAKQQSLVQETSMLINKDDLMSVAVSAEKRALAVLYQDMIDNSADGYTDKWAKYDKSAEHNDIKINTNILDLSGRFNINNLHVAGKVNETQTTYFERLLAELGLEPNITASIIDWQDSDNKPFNEDGAEHDYYAALEITPANQDFYNIQELKQVKDLNSNALQALQPNIITLPRPSKININTAPFAVITALSKTLDRSAVLNWVNERKKRPIIENVADLYSMPLFAGMVQKEKKAMSELLTTKSSLFLIKTKITQKNTQLYVYSYVYKEDNSLTVYQREVSSFDILN